MGHCILLARLVAPAESRTLNPPSLIRGRDAHATGGWHWWRDKREQMVLKAEDILRQIESAGYQVTPGRESIGDGPDGALRGTPGDTM